jgi:hypothetical protein
MKAVGSRHQSVNIDIDSSCSSHKHIPWFCNTVFRYYSTSVMCRMCILSKDFATLGQRPYVYNRDFISGLIMCFSGLGLPIFRTNMCGQRKSPCDSISPSTMTVFHQSVGCSFRWLLYTPLVLLAFFHGRNYLNYPQTHCSGILDDVSFDTHLSM